MSFQMLRNPWARFAILFTVAILVLIVMLQNDAREKMEKRLARQRLKNDDRDLLANWRRCIMAHAEKIRGMPDIMWKEFPEYVRICEFEIATHLTISEIWNTDEAKYHIMPKKNYTSVVVTMGIGHDVTAETALRQKLQGRVELYGADPVMDINDKLFSEIGTFYPFAVGDKDGTQTAEVLEGKTDGVATKNDYSQKQVIYVHLVKFLKKMIRHTIYDSLWMDTENAEYPVLPMFHRGGDLDKNGITVCQMNMEVHWPDDEKKKQFHDFVFQIIEDERYAFLKAEPVGHMRLYLVNMDDGECLNRFH